MNSASSADARDPALVSVSCYPPKKEEGSLGGLYMTVLSDKIVFGNEHVEVSPFVCVCLSKIHKVMSSKHQPQASIWRRYLIG